MSTYKYIILLDKKKNFAYCNTMHVWEGAKKYKPFTILNCKFSFYSLHSSYVFLHKHKFREIQAHFQSAPPLRSTAHATGSVIPVCFKDTEFCSAWEYHSLSTSLIIFIIIKILKWQFHTLPTPEVPGSYEQNHQHLEWPSSTKKEIHSIFCFKKRLICHVTIKWLYQQQWEQN